MEIKSITYEMSQAVKELVATNWGAPLIVSKGKVHYMDMLPGYVAVENDKIKGLITYSIDSDEWEIVSLDSFSENKGIGTKLINYVVKEAEENKCKRVWLITTNDNIKAIRFYQKRGFNMVALHVDAIKKSRAIKPEIPLIGFDDIPILHEIEFEMRLD